MNKFLVSVVVLVLGIVSCTHARPGKGRERGQNAAVGPSSNVVCPRFPTRYEDDNLVIEIEEGECEMVISSVNMLEEHASKVEAFRRRVKAVFKKVNLPSVLYRPLMTISEEGNSETGNQTSVNETMTTDGNDTLATSGNETMIVSGNDTIENSGNETMTTNDTTVDDGTSVPGGNVALETETPCTKRTHKFVGPVLVIDTVEGECQMMIVAHGNRGKGKIGKLMRRFNKNGKLRQRGKQIVFEYIDDSFF